MKNMLKDALILFIITIVAGLALGFADYITREPIAQAEAERKVAAYNEVFPTASSFEEISDAGQMLSSSEWESAGYSNVEIDGALLAKDSDGNVLGYVILITSKEGYGGDISFSMGIQKDGTINDISILTISETAGLGMKAEDVLQPQFTGDKVQCYTVTKTEPQNESEIDAISGATITSEALTKGVNAGLYFYQTALGGGKYEG